MRRSQASRRYSSAVVASDPPLTLMRHTTVRPSMTSIGSVTPSPLRRTIARWANGSRVTARPSRLVVERTRSLLPGREQGDQGAIAGVDSAHQGAGLSGHAVVAAGLQAILAGGIVEEDEVRLHAGGLLPTIEGRFEAKRQDVPQQRVLPLDVDPGE